jgi:DNA-binding NtrC family response regulator
MAQADWVWVPSHYVWATRGYVFVPGHWDYSLARRGVLFAPVYFPRPVYELAGFSYALSVVVDIAMSGEESMGLIARLHDICPDLPVIIMTAYSDLESAVAAFQGGAFEYLPKPFDVDHAVELVRRAMEESLHQGAAPEAEIVTLVEITGLST